MADELYTDNQVEPNPGPDAGPGPEMDEETTEKAGTKVLPKDFFQGKDIIPGSTCTIRVVEVYDDSVEVEYVSHDESVETEQPAGVAMPPESGMAGMME